MTPKTSNSRLSRRSLVMAAALALSGAATARAGGDGFTKIDAAQLHDMLASKDFFFVNVHIPYEGEIAPTDAEIPFDTITEHLDKLPSDKAAKIVLYCRSGRMSDLAARDLVRLGYSQVYELAGGMIGWKAAGYPVVEK